MNKKVALLFAFVLIAVVGYIYYLVALKDTYSLKVNFQNTGSVLVVSEENYKNNVADSSKKISSSGDSVRLKKDKYIVIYTASEGYAGGQKNVDLTQQNQTIDINPPYSTDRLDSLLNNEIQAVNSVIKSEISGIGQYRILKGQLFSYGEWYGTALIYQGKDYYNADSLRLVMKKEGDTWKLLSFPPTIALSKYYYKEVPIEVLDGINNIPAPIDPKFIN